MIRRLFSGRFSRVKKIAAVIIVLLLVLYFALVSLITSDTFSHWVVSKAQNFVPELSINNLQGNFFSGLTLNGSYVADDVHVDIAELGVSINSRCLWTLSVCIDFVRAEKITVTLQETKDVNEKEPVQLPSISLPVSITLKQLSVAKLAIEKNNLSTNKKISLYQTESVLAKANIKKSTLTIDEFSARDDFCNWSAKARLILNKKYPLSSTIECQSVSGFGEAIAKISGSVTELDATINSNINVNQIAGQQELTDSSVVSTAIIHVKPLAEKLPIKAELNLNEPLRILLNSHYVDLIDTKIHLEGDMLSSTIQLDANLITDINPENILVTSHAVFENKVLDIASLKVDFPNGEMTTVGQLTLADGVDWSGTTTWEDIGLEQWTIIPSSKWLAGTLSGAVNTDVQYENQTLNATIELPEMTGKINQQPLSATGLIKINGDSFLIDNFAMNYANQNQIAAVGAIHSNNADVNINFNFQNIKPFVEQFSENASGAINGKASLKGGLDAPKLYVDALANNIIYNQLQITHSSILADWNTALEKNTTASNAAVSNIVRVKAEGIRNGESNPTNASFVINGNAQDHNLLVDWIEPKNQKESATLRCSGKFPSANSTNVYDRWVGMCDELTVKYDWQGEQQLWALTDSIEIDYSAKPLEFSVSTFCLKNNDSKICNQEFINYIDGDIANLSVVGELLPLNWLKPFLPNSMLVDGHWEFVLQGSNVISENDLSAEIMTIGAAVLFLSEEGISSFEKNRSDVLQDEKNIQARINVKKLLAQWRWNNKDPGAVSNGHQVTWELNTEKNGNLLGHLNLADQLLDGELIAQKIQLKDVSNLVILNQEDIVTGEINGQLTLTGSLNRPVFNGQLALTDGYVESTMTPVPIKNITMDLDVANNVASLDGKFTVNDGKGVVNGDIDWQVDTWSGELQLTADAIAIQPEPKMLVTVSPDLRLSMSPEELNLSGVITIPKARVEIEELPEQAISESSDAVIVGEQTKVSQQNIKTSLEIVLGDDVHFKGFGLETNIIGKLTIQQKNNELLKGNGVLELQKGRYKAYGQNLLIQEGDLVFVGNVENPQLRVSAIRAGITDDVTVGLLATGSIVNPRISLFSQPSMSQQAQLSYLLTGNAPGVEVSTDPALAATEAALSYALASDVGLGFTKKAGEALGIDDLQLTAGSSSGNSDGGTQIGLSGYVTPKLMVRYGVGVFDAFNSLTLNYRLSKNLYLEVISGESSALDLLWSFERD